MIYFGVTKNYLNYFLENTRLLKSSEVPSPKNSTISFIKFDYICLYHEALTGKVYMIR